MIRRGPRPETHYLQVANAVVCDRRLSFGATGLLVHLLSKPEHWEVSVKALSNVAKEGRDKIYKLINELIDCGYCERITKRNSQGKVIGTDYEIFDMPRESQKVSIDPLPEKPEVEPLTENPYPVKPYPVNPTQEKKEVKKETISERNQFNTQVGGFDFASWPTIPSGQVLRDWKKTRQAKQAPLTQTAIDRLATEMHSAVTHGYSVDDCLGLCCEKGWRGFKLEWLLNHENQQGQGKVAAASQNPSQRLTRNVSVMDQVNDTNW